MGSKGVHATNRQASNLYSAVTACCSDLTPRFWRLALHRCSFRSTNSPFGVGLNFFFFFFTFSLVWPVFCAPCIDRLFSKKWVNAGRCWAADQHLLRSYKRSECNRDPKLSEVKCLEHRRSPTTRRSTYASSSRCGAPHCGAASTARACSSVAVKCKAACLSVYTYKLTSYMSLCLWAILQENYREEYGLQTPTEP